MSNKFLLKREPLVFSQELNIAESPSQFPYILGGPSEILLNFLYLGDLTDARNESKIRDLGITHIVNVTTEIPNFIQSLPKIDYFNINVNDTPRDNISAKFMDAINFIENVRKINGKVLVHCAMGISRSATIVLAYIMYTQKINLDTAYQLVKSRRHIISPNTGFLGALLKFSENIYVDVEVK